MAFPKHSDIPACFLLLHFSWAKPIWRSIICWIMGSKEQSRPWICSGTQNAFTIHPPPMNPWTYEHRKAWNLDSWKIAQLNTAFKQLSFGFQTKMPYREPTVFWKRHVGNQLCFYHMIPNVILPQIGLAQEKQITPYREPTMFWKRHIGNQLCFDPMIQNIILPQIGLARERIKNNAM